MFWNILGIASGILLVFGAYTFKVWGTYTNLYQTKREVMLIPTIVGKLVLLTIGVWVVIANFKAVV